MFHILFDVVFWLFVLPLGGRMLGNWDSSYINSPVSGKASQSLIELIAIKVVVWSMCLWERTS